MKCIFYEKKSVIIAGQIIGLLKASAIENKTELNRNPTPSPMSTFCNRGPFGRVTIKEVMKNRLRITKKTLRNAKEVFI